MEKLLSAKLRHSKPTVTADYLKVSLDSVHDWEASN